MNTRIFRGNALENVGSYMREGVQRIGEDVIGTAIDHLIANQDLALDKLQNLQQWQVIKTVQKLVASKFLPHYRLTPSVRESELLNRINDLVTTGDATPVSLGKLRVTVRGVDAVLLPVGSKASEIARTLKDVRWKLEARVGHVSQELMAVSAQPPPGTDDDAPEPCRFPASIRWPRMDLDLGDVYDLTCDLELMLWTTTALGTKNQDESLVELSQFFGSTRKILQGPQSSANADELNEGMLPVDGTAAAPVGGTPWTLHGRVCIPLSTLISQSDGVSHVQVLGDRRLIKLSGNWHFYPANQDLIEHKYLRPHPGYITLGMLASQVSRGFIDLSLSFETPFMTPISLSLVSNLNTPEQVWSLPTKFDLQALECAGLRFHHLVCWPPRWIHGFGHLYHYWIARDWPPVLPLTAFWVLLTIMLVFARLWLVPILFGALVLLVSNQYRVNDTDTARAVRLAPLQPLQRGVGVPDQRMKAAASAAGTRSTGTTAHVAGWLNSSVIDVSTPRVPMVGRAANRERLSEYQILLQRHHVTTPQSTVTGPLPGTVPSLLLAPRDIPPSSIASMLGRIDVLCRDETAQVPVFPVFSDDVNEMDVATLKHGGLVVMELTQMVFQYSATLVEKIKFGLDWTDPQMAIMTWTILVVCSLEMALLLAVLSLSPGWLLRLAFLWVPVCGMMLCTDPEFLRQSGWGRHLDYAAVCVSRWQPESHLLLRFCQDIWDLLYLVGVIDWETRGIRMLQREVVERSPLDRPPPVEPSSSSAEEALHRGPFVSAPFGRTAVIARSSASVVKLSRHGSYQLVRWFRFTKQEKSWGQWLVRMSRATRLIATFLLRKVLWSAAKGQLRYIYYWFLRLPDRREIEHRQVAATQYLGADLLPFAALRQKSAVNPRDIYSYYRAANRELQAVPSVSGMTAGLWVRRGGDSGAAVGSDDPMPETGDAAQSNVPERNVSTAGGTPVSWYPRRQLESMMKNSLIFKSMKTSTALSGMLPLAQMTQKVPHAKRTSTCASAELISSTPPHSVEVNRRDRLNRGSSGRRGAARSLGMDSSGSFSNSTRPASHEVRRCSECPRIETSWLSGNLDGENSPHREMSGVRHGSAGSSMLMAHFSPTGPRNSWVDTVSRLMRRPGQP